MKKLLSLLGSIAITASSASTVVACSESSYQSDITNKQYKVQDTKNENLEIQAGVLARMRSIILSDQYGISDSIANDFSMQQRAGGNGGVISDGDAMSNKTAKQVFENLFNSKSIDKATYSDNINRSGTYGENGGIFDYMIQAGINGLLSKNSWLKPFLSMIPGVSSILNNQSSTGKQIADTVKDYFPLIAAVNTNTAVDGVAYALKLIPTVEGYNGITSNILSGALTSLINAYIPKDKINSTFGLLEKATDLSKDNSGTDLSQLSLDGISTQMSSIINNLISNKSTNKFMDVIRLLSFASNYLSFFDKDVSISVKQQFTNNKDKKLSDSELYKVNNGKGFNIAELIKDVSYFFGTDAKTNDGMSKIIYFAQTLLLSSDADNGGFKLNDMGLLVSQLLQNLQKQINPNTTLVSDDWNNALLAIIAPNSSQNTDSLTYTALVKNAGVNKLLNTDVFGKYQDELKENHHNYLDILFNDDLSDLGLGFGNKLKVVYNSAFSIDESVQNKDKNRIKVNLANIISTTPLWKILMLANVSGYTQKDIADNNGLIPNYAGYYTQQTISSLASQLGSMFKVDSMSIDNIKYHYLDFSVIQDLLIRLLFDDGNGQSVLTKLVQDINDTDKMAKDLGYVLENSVLAGTNIYTDSLLGDLIKISSPESVASLDVNSRKAYDSTKDFAGKEDNLSFLFSGVSVFLGNIISGTNYKEWLQDIFVYGPNDTFSIYDQKIDSKFSDGRTKSATFIIKFDPKGIEVTNGQILAENVKYYTVTISRSAPQNNFEFNSINRAVPIK